LRAGCSIKGALKPFDGTKYFPVLNAHQPVLSSPVFVNNSPEGS